MSDISTHYGGSVMAVVGKECVGIIADHRLGNGYIAVSKSFNRIYQATSRSMVGFTGFLPDAQHLISKLKTRTALFRYDEGREIEPDELAHLISYMLYSNRRSPLYVSVIVAGLSKDGEPYVCGMDSLGCMSEPNTFVVSGTAEVNLFGMCEVLFRPEMDQEELFTMCGQAFLNALNRDAFSGWGAECIIVTPTQRISKELAGACD